MNSITPTKRGGLGPSADRGPDLGVDVGPRRVAGALAGAGSPRRSRPPRVEGATPRGRREASGIGRLALPDALPRMPRRERPRREPLPSIPDFTDALAGVADGPADAPAILEGQGKSMPAMKGKLSAVDVTNLLVLIRNFQGGRQLIPEDEEADEPPSVCAPDAGGRPAERPQGPVPPAIAARTAAPLFQRSCRVCHGADGKGDVQRTAMPEIPDFSTRTWQERRSRAELTASILEGRGTHMPGFGDTLSALQARELVEFVRRSAPPRRNLRTARPETSTSGCRSSRKNSKR